MRRGVHAAAQRWLVFMLVLLGLLAMFLPRVEAAEPEVTSTTASQLRFEGGRFVLGTAPTPGQVLSYNGTAIVGADVLASDAGITSLELCDANPGLCYPSAANTWTRLTLAADKCLYASSASALATFDCVTFGRSVLELTSAADAQDLFDVVPDEHDDDNQFMYFSGGWTAEPFTATALELVNDASFSAMRTSLGLGTIATQNANSVSISGGSITGITDLAVADGGTGSSTGAAAAVALNLRPAWTVPSTVTSTDTTACWDWQRYDGTGVADWTFTLPAVSGTSGCEICFKEVGGDAASTITVDGNGAELIDNAANFTLTAAYAESCVMSDGSKWWRR